MGLLLRTNLKKYVYGAIGLVLINVSLFPIVWKMQRTASEKVDEIPSSPTVQPPQIQNMNNRVFVSPVSSKRQDAELGSEARPIRALHATLEFSQSEVGGIAAVTKTLIPKLNENLFETKVDATVIMPKYSFLRFEKSRMKKIATVPHLFRNGWVSSDIYQAESHILLVSPTEENLSNMYAFVDKSGIYTDDATFFPIERWLHFNSAVAAFVSQHKDPLSDQPFHVLHAHSYHSAACIELLSVYDDVRKAHKIGRPKTVLHMHGLSYDQGWIKGELFRSIGLQSTVE